MSNNDDRALQSEASFESLLGRAAPRPVPSQADTDAVRRAVHAEWQDIVRLRQRRRYTGLALAASAVLAVAVVINLLQPVAPSPVLVATVDKAIGAPFSAVDGEMLLVVNRSDLVMSGTTLRTDANASLSLAWESGGSVRVGPNSVVEIAEKDQLHLQQGVVYVDSRGAMQSFVVGSALGDVTHLGTQYLVDLQPDTLIVSVRDGAVSVEGTYHSAAAIAGERVELRGSSRPVNLSIPIHGNAWSWIEDTATLPELDKASALALIEWVAAETGCRLDISNELASELDAVSLQGTPLSDRPRAALQQAISALDLDGGIEGDRIVIRTREAY